MHFQLFRGALRVLSHMTKAPCLLILAGLLAASPGAAQTEQSPSTPLVITGGRLIDGYGGKPLENAVIVIVGGKIQEVGQIGSVAVPPGARIIDAEGASVLPGLWESHGHLFHVGEGDPPEFQEKFRQQSLDIMAAVAKHSLLSGITTFRDTGGPLEESLRLKADIEAGTRPGPRLFVAGTILRQVSRRTSPRCASCFDGSVANASEAAAAVRYLAKAGVDQVKVYGFWDAALLKIVTDSAHALGLGVDADVRHPLAYRTAIETGVDRLHHVFMADPLSDYSEEETRLLVRGSKPAGTGPSANIIRGPYIIPTVEMREAYVRVGRYPEMLDHPDFRSQYSEEVYRHLLASWKNPSSVAWGIGAEQRVPAAKEKLRQFIQRGGREQIVAGTDAGSPFNVHSPLVREIRRLHEAGLTPMEAIQSATLRAAQMQGVAEKLGTVSPGKLADVIIVDGDPLGDLSVLEHKLIVVIKDGKVVMNRRQN